MKGINGLTRLPRIFLSLVVCVWLVVTYSASAAEKETQFMRFVDDNAGGGKLQTAIVTYTNPAGVKIHLVAAVHVADTVYYKDLAKTFTGYDALLYEMVKPKDMGAPGREAVRANGIDIVHILQKGLKTFLDLDYQLEGIDYTKKNFVHADMDRAAFEKAQAERGESFETLMLQQLLAAMKNPQAHALPGGDAVEDPEKMLKELVKLVTRPDMERQVKTFVARQMDQMQDAAMGLDGPGGSVILTERNKAALKVLDETIKAGKKKITLFYGAAHMPDLSKRVREMGFKPSGPVEWKAAWDLHIRADQPSAVEKLLNDFIDALDEPEAPANPDGVF